MFLVCVELDVPQISRHQANWGKDCTLHHDWDFGVPILQTTRLKRSNRHVPQVTHHMFMFLAGNKSGECKRMETLGGRQNFNPVAKPKRTILAWEWTHSTRISYFDVRTTRYGFDLFLAPKGPAPKISWPFIDLTWLPSGWRFGNGC